MPLPISAVAVTVTPLSALTIEHRGPIDTLQGTVNGGGQYWCNCAHLSYRSNLYSHELYCRIIQQGEIGCPAHARL